VPDSSAGLSPEQDFFDLEAVLEADDRRLLAEVRAFMREEVAPIINDYWSREEFPHQVRAWPISASAESPSTDTAVRAAGCSSMDSSRWKWRPSTAR
jgi:glutaryl-CoA dehydrogenase